MKKNTNETLGSRLKELRGNRTQKEFANLLSIGRTTLIKYESDERSPDAELLIRINLLFATDLYWLLTGKGSALAGEKLTVREADLLKLFRDADEGQKAAIEAVAKSLLKRP